MVSSTSTACLFCQPGYEFVSVFATGVECFATVLFFCFVYSFCFFAFYFYFFISFSMFAVSTKVSIDSMCTGCGNLTVQDDNETIGATCKLCPSGYTYVNNNEVCATCPPGKFDVIGDILFQNQHSCHTCNKGQSSRHWRSACTHCVVGLYQESNVSTVWGCKHCPTGKEYMNVNTSCTSCSSGKYQDER